MQSLQQTPTAARAAGRAEPPLPCATGSASPAHGAAPSSLPPNPKGNVFSLPTGSRPPQAAEEVPKSAGAIGRGSIRAVLPHWVMEMRIKPTACVSTEGGNHFRGAPERGWPKGPAILRLPIIQHQAPPGTTDQRQSSPKPPTFTAGAGGSRSVRCPSKQHRRGKKTNIKNGERSPKSIQSQPCRCTSSPSGRAPSGAWMLRQHRYGSAPRCCVCGGKPVPTAPSPGSKHGRASLRTDGKLFEPWGCAIHNACKRSRELGTVRLRLIYRKEARRRAQEGRRRGP